MYIKGNPSILDTLSTSMYPSSPDKKTTRLFGVRLHYSDDSLAYSEIPESHAIAVRNKLNEPLYSEIREVTMDSLISDGYIKEDEL